MAASMSNPHTNPHTPPDGLRTGQSWLSSMPDFDGDESFVDVVKPLSLYVVRNLD